jgi:hypothetical protein
LTRNFLCNKILFSPQLLQTSTKFFNKI